MNKDITGFVVQLSETEILHRSGKRGTKAQSVRVLFSAYEPDSFVGFAQVDAMPLWAPMFYHPKNRTKKLLSIPRSFQDLREGGMVTFKGAWRKVRAACDSYVFDDGVIRQALVDSGQFASDSPQWLADRLNLFRWRWHPYDIHFLHADKPCDTLWALDYFGAARALKEACRFNGIGVDLGRLAESCIRNRPLVLAGQWDDKSQTEAVRFLSCTETRVLQELNHGVRRVRG